MENYHYLQPISSPPPSSWVGNGENSSSTLHQSKERRGGKRGAGVKLSTDPQSVAARQRRHRISDRFRILKSLVPGGSKMDTVSMLEEAINYVKFLKTQIWLHQAAMMIPTEDSPLITYTPTRNITTSTSGGVFTHDTIVSSPSHILPTQQLLCYSMPPPPPTLPPFPYCSFQGEEEMLPPVSINY